MKKTLFTITACCLLFFAMPVFTQERAPGGSNVSQGSTVNLVNPIGGTKENPRGISVSNSSEDVVSELTSRVIVAALGLAGSLTLLVFIYGGFTWLTSAGAPDKIKRGWHAMLYSALGLFIIFGAYAIISTVIRGITGSN